MTTNNIKIFDVTLRESVYTSKNYNIGEVNKYLSYINSLNLADIFEFGYIDIKGNGKLLSTYNETIIKMSKDLYNGEISSMFHLSEFDECLSIWNEDVLKLLDYVRIVIDDDISKLNKVTEYFHNLNIKVAINYSYMSRFSNNKLKEILINILNNNIDIIYIVDTNGYLFPNDILNIYNIIKEIDNKVSIGFHGHNHMNMVTYNTYLMMENNIDYLDGTIGGYGKGSGNLKLEIIPLLDSKLNNKKMDINLLNNIYNVLKVYDKSLMNNFLNSIYAYKNLKLYEINNIIKSSNEKNFINNIMEYKYDED